MEDVKQYTPDAAADRVRSAFGGGISLTSAAILLMARDDGLGWEAATRAVADGLAEHYGPPPPVRVSRQRRNRLLVAIAAGLVAYLVVRPVLSIGYELTVAAIAWTLHGAVATNAWEALVQLSGLDPIYTGTAIRAAGGVQVLGFVIAGPIGDFLHNTFPAVFLGADHLAGKAVFTMVASPGAPALGRGLAAFGADIIWLSIGLWLFWRWRDHNWLVALVGLFIQAQIGLHHLLEAHVALADIDASGLSFAVQNATPNGGWLTAGLAQLPATQRDLIIGGFLLALGYLAAVLIVAAGIALRRLLHFRRKELPASSVRPARSIRFASVALALATASSPIGALAMGTSNWQMNTNVAAFKSLGSTGPTAGAALPPGPSVVTINHPSDSSWQYVVNGQVQTIHGVGYNPWYAGLSTADRVALYQRDFSAMHDLGINTIEGWFEGQFDSVTLNAAAANGIGVLMPFELNQDWDYTDPNVQASILARVSAYVEEYKDYPAVRMWAPGNENLHRDLYAHWISQLNNPVAVAKAAAVAAFLPKIVDRIHQLDPNHPVLYRDAEDVYLPWITQAFQQAGGGDRPWLVYGANVYTAARLQQVIGTWPSQWPGRPLIISEFAPGGMGPADRPLAFEQDWQIIRSRPDVVLGGLAYTWATNGPEDLDRVFGLVDANGIPTDGSLAALSVSYLGDSQRAAAGSPG